MTLLRTLNHRFLRLRLRALGSALLACGALLLGGSLAVGGPGAAITIVRAANTANPGTVKVHNVNTGVSNEEEPHLSCDAAIEILGSDFGIGSTSGGYTIEPQAPTSGAAYPGTWTYSSTGGTDQLIATVPANTLSAGHFKLSSDNETFKSKVFWVVCDGSSPSPSPSGSPSPSPSTSPSPSPSSSPSPSPSGSPSPSPSGSPSPSPSGSPSPSPSTSPSPSPSGSPSPSPSSSPSPSPSSSPSPSPSSSSSTSTGGVGGTGGQNPPGTGAGTTTITSAPATSTGGQQQVVASVPEHQLSVPESGADIPFVSGFLLLLAGGGLLAAARRRAPQR